MSHMTTHRTSADPLRSYLDRVGDQPLLTHEDEVRLGLQLEQARLQLCCQLCTLGSLVGSRNTETAEHSLADATPDGVVDTTTDELLEATEPSAHVAAGTFDEHLQQLGELHLRRERLREEPSHRRAAGDGRLQAELDQQLRDLLDALWSQQREIDTRLRRLRDTAAGAERALRRVRGEHRTRLRRQLATKTGMGLRQLFAIRDQIVQANRQAEQAKATLVESNLRLVLHHAKHYATLGVPFGDLVQEGNLGLMRAVDKFNPRLGYRFSTYASWWIRQAITRAVPEHHRTIRLPVHVVELQRRLTRARRSMEAQLGREPTVEELAIAADLPPERVAALTESARDVRSLDEPVGHEASAALGDFVAAPDGVRADVALERNDVAEQTRQLLDALPPREAMVLRLRFGVDARAPHTLQEIGDQLGVTRERARQIEARALQRLRPAARQRTLAG